MTDPAPAKVSLADRVTRILSVIGGLAIFAILIHTLANVAMRFLFDAPLPNAIEIISYWYMLILAYTGFVLAKLAKQTMDAPIIFDKLTWGNRRLLMVFSHALVAVFCAVVAYFTLTGDALPAARIERMAGASTLPVWPVLFIVPLVFGVLAILYAVDAVRAVRGVFDEEPEDVEAVLAESEDEIEFGITDMDPKPRTDPETTNSDDLKRESVK